MNWDTIPSEQVADGIQRQMVVGEKLMICRLKIQPRVVTAVHTHEHELHFRPHQPHGATMLEEVVLVDVFTPRREDFLTSKRSA